MGCSHSLISEEMVRDRKISRQLKKDYVNDSKIAKLLLLGAGKIYEKSSQMYLNIIHYFQCGKFENFSTTASQGSKENTFDMILMNLEPLTFHISKY